MKSLQFPFNVTIMAYKVPYKGLFECLVHFNALRKQFNLIIYLVYGEIQIRVSRQVSITPERIHL